MPARPAESAHSLWDILTANVGLVQRLEMNKNSTSMFNVQSDRYDNNLFAFRSLT